MRTSRRAGPSSRLAEAYLREGDLLTLLKRFDAADRALSTALRISQEQGDAALERNTLRSIGLLRWHEGRHAEALAITEHALAIDAGLPRRARGRRRPDQSRRHSQEHGRLPAARDPQARGSPGDAVARRRSRKLVYALHNLANVHRAMNQADPALACLRRADETCRTHLLPIQRSFHLTSIAHIDFQQGRVDDALRTYREAIALSRRARHATGLAQSLRTLGEVLFGLGMGDEALPCLQEAARLFAQLEDPAAEAAMWSRAAAVLASRSQAG